MTTVDTAKSIEEKLTSASGKPAMSRREAKNHKAAQRCWAVKCDP